MQRRDRPAVPLVDCDQRNQHIEQVAVFAAFRRAPQFLDPAQGRFVIGIGLDRTDVHPGFS